MKPSTAFLCVCAACALCGCATVTRGTKEVLVVGSEPIGAKVTTSIGLTGTTPATFKVSRKGGFVVTIEKEGYETVQVQVASQVAGGGAAGMAGNIILGGLIGAAVDAGSGATKQLKPNPIHVKLNPIVRSEGDAAPGSPQADGVQPADASAPGPVSFRIDLSPLGDDSLLVSVEELDAV